MIVLALLLAAAPAPPRAWALHAGGGLAIPATEFTATSRYVELAEEATVSTRQRPGSGAALEAGLSRALSSWLGFAVVVARDQRDAPGTFSATLPHPLYLARHRSATGPFDGGARRETAVHFALSWSRAVGGLTVRAAAGPSYILAEADLVDGIDHEDAYPYDETRVTSVRMSSARGDALGGHLALGLERRLSSRLALAGGARWSRAKVRLESGTGDATRSAEITAGGLSAGLGLRLYF